MKTGGSSDNVRIRTSDSTRVALVDDDPGVLRSWEQILTSASWRCAGAFSNPETAVREIPSLSPDVILMDIRMPGLSGIDCTRILCGRMTRPRIIMVSAVTDFSVVRQAFEAGALGYLVKGECEHLILDGISFVLKNGTPLSETVRKSLGRDANWSEQPDWKMLTPRQKQILHFLAFGYTDKMLAEATGLCLSTVRTHMRELCRRAGAHSRGEAALKFLGAGQKPFITFDE